MSLRQLLLLLLVALAGCTGDGGTTAVGQPDSSKDLAASPDDGRPGIETTTFDSDTLSVDLGGEELRFPPEIVEGCGPGEGCFQEKCAGNQDCQSSWCVEHMGEGVCTVTCTEECPQGWACRQVSDGGPDVFYICVSSFANLCKPCVSSDNCKSPGGAEDVCVDYGAEGSFCGGKCEEGADCPWGFLCLDAVTVDGIATRQCVAEAGVCPCTNKSVELALWSECAVENEFGKCAGKRVCTDAGLSDCDAAMPAEEQCNGLDDNCDGDTDEALFVEGEYVNLCDDGNDCTKDACKGEGGCEHTPLDGGECADGDACTAADHCAQGTCVGLPVVCDDDNPCTDDYCDGIGGCLAEFNAEPCDDSDPCTVGDTCKQGQCSGFSVDCDCLDDQDCQALDDDDKCNGVLFCDKSKTPYRCRTVEGSTVDCSAIVPEDPICQTVVCQPESGKCAVLPAHEGYACDDGSACTLGDKCGGGVCVPGPAQKCADGNPCTDDSCDTAAGCVHVLNNSPCNDGNPCTIGDVCEQGKCSTSGLLTCDDSNPCTKDSCDSSVGCLHEPAAGACNDGNECTVNDVCTGGQCKSKEMLVCDDSNECTTDTCLPIGGCSFKLNQAPCDDGNVCTTGDHCHLGDCISSGVLACNDKNPCTDDSCNPETGCSFAPNSGKCNDESVCTSNDHCLSGMCVPGATLDCNDDNFCTADSCDPKLGCQHGNIDAACDDGDACTQGETCSGGKCGSGNAVSCDDGNPCTDDECKPPFGCFHVANGVACDDGDACSTGDTCAGGKCKAGALVECDDGNVCTANSCDKTVGCVFTPAAGGCDDGNKCTENDHCEGGGCKSTQQTVCNDSKECTTDSCDPKTGCVFTPVADGTPCGQQDWKCKAGQCVQPQPCVGGWFYEGRCWYSGPVMSQNNCPSCGVICAGHGGCNQTVINQAGLDQSCKACKATACPNCGCQDGPGNVSAHEAAPIFYGSMCEYTDHPNYPPLCDVVHYCNSEVWGKKRLCPCNEVP